MTTHGPKILWIAQDQHFKIFQISYQWIQPRFTLMEMTSASYGVTISLEGKIVNLMMMILLHIIITIGNNHHHRPNCPIPLSCHLLGRPCRHRPGDSMGSFSHNHPPTTIIIKSGQQLDGKVKRVTFIVQSYFGNKSVLSK